MDIRKDIYGIDKPADNLEKKAGVADMSNALAQTVINGIAGAGAMGVTYLLAGATLMGAGAGWGAAKLSAKGKRDMDTVRKSYESQRLSADLGYLRGKLRDEFETKKRQQGPKAARIFN